MKISLFVIAFLFTGCSLNPFPDHKYLDYGGDDDFPAKLIGIGIRPIIVDNKLILLNLAEDTCFFYNDTSKVIRTIALRKRVKSIGGGNKLYQYQWNTEYITSDDYIYVASVNTGCDYYYNYKEDSFREIYELQSYDFESPSNDRKAQKKIVESLPKGNSKFIDFEKVKELQKRYEVAFVNINTDIHDPVYYRYLVKGTPMWYTFESTLKPDTLGISSDPYLVSQDFSKLYSEFASKRNGNISLQEIDSRSKYSLPDIHGGIVYNMIFLYSLQIKDTAVQFKSTSIELNWYTTNNDGKIFFILDDRAYISK